MDLSLIVPRPISPKQDPERVKVFLNFIDAVKATSIPLWYFDETGVEINRKPRRIIAKKGSRPVYPYGGEHIRENILGAVNPQTGQLETLVMPYSDTETFQLFLDYFNETYINWNIMVLDNASWHKTAGLKWGKIISIYLPPYSPNLNAIEPLWKVLKGRLPIMKPINNYVELQDLISEHIRQLIDKPEDIKSACKISDKIN
jgi:transposase